MRSMSVTMKQTKSSVLQNLHCAWDRGDRIPEQLNALLRRHKIPSIQWTQYAVDTYLRDREIGVDDRMEIKAALRQIGEFKAN
jgi:hypothetical protein